MAFDQTLELLQEFQRLDRKKRAGGAPLTPEEEERWAGLRELLAEALGGERPAAGASLGVMRVRYRRAQTFANNYLDNIQGGGVFIKTKNPFPLDTMFTVRFVFDDKDREFDVQVRVVWENTVESPSGKGPATGMGVKFLDLDEDNRIFMRDCLHEAEQEAEAPLLPQESTSSDDEYE